MTDELDRLSETELRRRAGIAVRQLGYNSLREYELAMYRKAIEEMQKKQPRVKQAA